MMKTTEVNNNKSKGNAYKHSCDICGKQFSQSQNMIKHRLNHTGGKPYACDICGKTFNQSQNVTRHRLIHKKFQNTDNPRPNECDICGKKFNQSKNVNQHILIHKKLKCKEYLQVNSKRKYTSQEKFQSRCPSKCPVCSKTFSRNDNLKRHFIFKKCQGNFLSKFNKINDRKKAINCLLIGRKRQVDIKPKKSSLNVLPNNKNIKSQQKKCSMKPDNKTFAIESSSKNSSNNNELMEVWSKDCELSKRGTDGPLVDTGEEDIETQIELVPKLNIKRVLGLEAWWLTEDHPNGQKGVEKPVPILKIKKEKHLIVNLSKSRKLVANYLVKSTKNVRVKLSRKDIHILKIENNPDENPDEDMVKRDGGLNVEYNNDLSIKLEGEEDDTVKTTKVFKIKRAPRRKGRKISSEAEIPKVWTQDLSPERFVDGKKVKYICVTQANIARGSPYQCIDCDYFSDLIVNVKKHYRKHTNEKPFGCIDCHKKFVTSGSVASHWNSHHNTNWKKDFSCEICGRSFEFERQLIRHGIVHSGESFACSICGKGYRSPWDRDGHEARHSKEITACPICGKNFSNLVEAEQHQERHEGKNYECDQCNTKAKTKGDLRIHNKIRHTKEDKCQCVTCGKTFRLKLYLTRHIKLVHEKSLQFKCVLCPQVLSSKQHFSRHSRSLHNGEMIPVSNRIK